MATDPETSQKLPVGRRHALKAIAFGAAGVTLAACGGAASTSPTAAPAEAPAEPTAAPAAGEPTPEPTPAVADIGAGAKSVVFWHGLGGADGATMQEMLKTYAADRAVGQE
ncbi:MAG TPA: hypothetical protein VFU22_03005 [Roseiflexaceae bacterium]|nr:hypothetical protein [Roseiflexaceae bacterium]